jgi:hypothetical protein
LAALAIAAAILAVAFFARQISLRHAEVLARYEEAGAATFVAEISGVADGDIDALASAVRKLGTVRSVEAPYSGVALGIAADTSFLVFQNAQQEEYLGARTNVLGIDRDFDLVRDYYVNFHSVNRNAPEAVLGIPLYDASGTTRAPGPGELLVASGVADYVGVRPNARSTLDLVYTGVDPPIVQRLDGQRLIGTFEVAGPDEGRFDPFWRFAARGQEVLTVRRSKDAEIPATTLPTVIDIETVRDFLAFVRRELRARGVDPSQLLPRDQLAIRANSVSDVPTAERAVETLLRQRGLEQSCDAQPSARFCLRLPERNNFQAALREQGKLASGGGFFMALLLMLVAIGTAGLQIQAVLMRWHEVGVLQAVGFSPMQIFRHFALRLLSVLIGGVGLAALMSLAVPSTVAGSLAAFAWAAAVAVLAAGLAALPILLWPLCRSPAELLREAL